MVEKTFTPEELQKLELETREIMAKLAAALYGHDASAGLSALTAIAAGMMHMQEMAFEDAIEGLLRSWRNPTVEKMVRNMLGFAQPPEGGAAC